MRTHQKHLRVYVDGFDLSGQSRSVGALAQTFAAEPDAALTDECKNILIGQGEVTAGAINTFLTNDADGAHALLKNGFGVRDILIAIGANAEPKAGDHVFAWTFEESEYKAEGGAGFVAATVTPGGSSQFAPLDYSKPWGRLLHAKSAESEANDALGVDFGSASSAGGIFVYHLLSSDGTVTLKAQHADTNNDAEFEDITGATSGAISATVTPKSGNLPLAVDEAIKRYVRWQVEFGTALTATFVVAFIKN
ncbi:MAG TPA: hypothetical protein PKC99_14250 [Anaerolineales bacterium]|nr:hypothetical protein [Anaerolineales bacterium]